MVAVLSTLTTHGLRSRTKLICTGAIFPRYISLLLDSIPYFILPLELNSLTSFQIWSQRTVPKCCPCKNKLNKLNKLLTSVQRQHYMRPSMRTRRKFHMYERAVSRPIHISKSTRDKTRQKKRTSWTIQSSTDPLELRSGSVATHSTFPQHQHLVARCSLRAMQ